MSFSTGKAESKQAMQGAQKALQLGLTCSRCFEAHLPAHEGEKVLDRKGMAALSLHFWDGTIQALQLHQPSCCVVQTRCVTIQYQLLHRRLITFCMLGVMVGGAPHRAYSAVLCLSHSLTCLLQCDVA